MDDVHCAECGAAEGAPHQRDCGRDHCERCGDPAAACGCAEGVPLREPYRPSLSPGAWQGSGLSPRSFLLRTLEAPPPGQPSGPAYEVSGLGAFSIQRGRPGLYLAFRADPLLLRALAGAEVTMPGLDAPSDLAARAFLEACHRVRAGLLDPDAAPSIPGVATFRALHTRKGDAARCAVRFRPFDDFEAQLQHRG